MSKRATDNWESQEDLINKIIKEKGRENVTISVIQPGDVFTLIDKSNHTHIVTAIDR